MQDDSPTGAYTVEGFSNAYDLSKASTYIEIRSGRLTARKLRSKTLILKSEAERWAESLPVKPAKSARWGHKPRNSKTAANANAEGMAA